MLLSRSSYRLYHETGLKTIYFKKHQIYFGFTIPTLFHEQHKALITMYSTCLKMNPHLDDSILINQDVSSAPVKTSTNSQKYIFPAFRGLGGTGTLIYESTCTD